jgi:hypothetical protein
MAYLIEISSRDFQPAHLLWPAPRIGVARLLGNRAGQRREIGRLPSNHSSHLLIAAHSLGESSV